MSAGKPLTTTQVASILERSRQHAVGLCDDGTLSFPRLDTHRRIGHAGVQKFVRPRLTFAEEHPLRMRYSIATNFVVDHRSVLAAAARLGAMRDAHSDSHRSKLYDRWQRLINERPPVAVNANTSRSLTSSDPLSESPLVRLLAQKKRTHLVTSFATYWRIPDSTAVAS